MIENPFRYGGVVRGPHFADREEELIELEREMRSNSRVFLVSPRRYGKTCLLFNLRDRLESKGIATTYLDLNAHPDLAGFAGAVAAETSRALESNVEKLSKVLSGLQRLRPMMTVDTDGTVSVGVEIASGEVDPLQALLEGLNHAEELAWKKKRNLVIIIDEFSDLLKYDGSKIEKALRSTIQQHEHIGYIFSGSEQSVMLSMVQERRRPFYKLGRLMGLGPIPRDQYRTFIAGWLKKGGYQFPEGGIDRILHLGSDIPYNIQRLCHTMWESAGELREISPGVIEELPEQIIRQDSPLYEMLWQTTTQIQKAVLMAVTESPELSPLSKDFMLKHRIGPPSSINASLKSLVNKGILYRDLEGRYRFTDSFMPRWITYMRQERR